ncbi:Protein kinase [Gracilaria domingensis]|nr:Protein kinase [Gracilaria domingensis]
MEKYTNLKLNNSFSEEKRFPEYVGELIIPGNFPIATGLSRLGLVWRRVGSGETLEDYINPSRISTLMSLLGAQHSTPPIRRGLAAAVLMELSLIVNDLQSCGIVHRDIKPENILVVPGDPAGTPLKAIDFGSSCDWKSPFKKGLRTATCDPVYAAPEKRLDLFRPAYRFDVYSIGLIVLRCAVPSLTEASAMSDFVTNVLGTCRFSLERACSAVLNGRLSASSALRQELEQLLSPVNEDLYAVLVTMLTEDPSSRADVGDCLRSRLLTSA